MKKLLAIVMTLVIVCTVVAGCAGKQSAAAPSAEADYRDFYFIHVKAPESWGTVCIWAWSNSEGDLFDAWPGMEVGPGMDAWYTIGLPFTYDNIVINGNQGTVQTADIATGAQELWLTVRADGSYLLSRSDPDNTENLSESQTELNYDALYDSAGISDYRVVSSDLSLMATVTRMDGGFMKMEFGYHAAFVEEIAIVYYYDMSGYSDDQLVAIIPALRESLEQKCSGMQFITTSDMLYNTWLAATIHATDLGNPDNAAILAQLLEMDASELSPVGTIIMPTAQEAEANGFYVKYEP